ncbi:hypothetical protein PINS_up012049 [Pythium insidiosum]|nr:hypothetical protein PINS_up012049 [Pythium insidiosum]
MHSKSKKVTIVNCSPGAMPLNDPDLAESGRLTMSMDISAHRFVAGDKFFNYQQYGALRSGGEVSLFSKNHCGLLVAAAHSAMVYALIRYCLRPTLMDSLQLKRVENSAVIECLISLPTSFSLFVGLFSDVFPIRGFHRKSYIILGCIVTFIMLGGLTALALTVNPTTTDQEGIGDKLIYYMLLIMGAMLGTLISKIATDARVIELSQREPLTSRGHLQINYLIFRAVCECLSGALTAYSVQYNPIQKMFHLKVNMAWAFLALAVFSLVPIPFVVFNCVEQSTTQNEGEMIASLAASGISVHQQSSLSSAGARTRAFLRMCQQRAVWQIVLFLSLVLATTRFFFGSANAALSALARLDRNKSLVTSAIRFVVNIVVMVGWKIWWSNSDWRRTMLCGLVVLVVAEVFRALMMLYVPSTRSQLFFDAMLCVMSVSDGVISIFSFIPATEIAEFGSEGATIGLLQSFRSCLAVAMRTLSEKGMSQVATVRLTAGSTDQSTLCLLLMISYGVHALSFFSVGLLPRQKLDAQQLRVYGGYSKIASAVLMAIFLVFFSFSTIVNLAAMVDMTKGST